MYKLKFFFEWGTERCLWARNEAARERFDLGPIDYGKLNISKKLWEELENLGEEYQTALDKNDPANGIIWSQEKIDDFSARAHAAWEELIKELGAEYSVEYDMLI